MRKFNFLRFLKKSRRGYILILVVFFIPIIMMGVKWCLDQSTLEQVKINSAGGNDSRSYKKCAKESALAVAQKWNPALTYNGQKESMLRLADEVYNNATAEGSTTSLIGRAIPGLEIHPKYKITNKGTLFNPVQVTPYGEAQSFMTEGRKIAYKNDQTADHRGKEFFDNDSSSEVYRRAYFLEKNSRAAFDTPFCDVILRREGDKHIPVLAFDSYYAKTDVKTHTPMSALAGGFQISPYDTDEMSSTIQIRSTSDDPKLKLSVEGDKIKVQVDSDIADDKVGDVGYAVPAECNVDIVLTIPVNAAACNKDNADANSTTAGSPSLVTATAIQTTNSKATTASTAGVSDMRKSPIYQIAQAYRTFLRENFEFTRGVNVGLIPYSGKVSLPPEKADTNDEATCWTENVNSFVWNPTETKVDNRDDYLRGMFLYGASGKSGTAPTTALTKENYLWGGWLCPTRHGGYGILCRNVSTDETHAGNTMYVGDVLSTADPETHKFKRMNYWPCQVGAVNMLNMKCTKDCTQFCHNPYFIVPLTPNVTKIHDLMNAIVPFYDDHNQSNLICIPVTWANNLFQDWAYPQAITASDTEGGGRLSNPKPNSTRKKVLILVVNKPDWFEPCELTYLGFDNDYSEVPMVESDRIDFHTNYSDLTLKYADGSSYDNKIRGQSKILLAETDAGVVYNNDAKYYESEEGTVTLKFPRKALVKVVVEPITIDEKWELTSSVDLSYATSSPTTYAGGGNANALSFVNGKFVLVTEAGYVLTSDDGKIWSEGVDSLKSLRSNTDWNYIVVPPCYVNGKYVVCGCRGHYATSTDLNTWDLRNKLAFLYSAGGDLFGSYQDGNSAAIFTYRGYISHSATEEDSWNSAVSGLNSLYTTSGAEISALCGIGDKVVAITQNGWTSVSTNAGSTWSSPSIALKALGEKGTIRATCYAYNKFFAFSKNGYASVSPDGYSWSAPFKMLTPNGDISAAAYGNNELVVLCGATKKLYYGTRDLTNRAPSTVAFPNLSGTDENYCLSNNKLYTITERCEFFIEPQQISGSDGNYAVKMKLGNIRLISAEITNRPYEKVAPWCELSGTTSGSGEAYIKTNVDRPLTLRVNKILPQGSITFYDDNFVSDCRLDSTSGEQISLNNPYNFSETKTFVFSGAAIDGQSSWNVSSCGRNFARNLSNYKVRYSTKDTQILNCTLHKQVLRAYWGRFQDTNKVSLMRNDCVLDDSCSTHQLALRYEDGAQVVNPYPEYMDMGVKMPDSSIKIRSYRYSNPYDNELWAGFSIKFLGIKPSKVAYVSYSTKLEYCAKDNLVSLLDGSGGHARNVYDLSSYISASSDYSEFRTSDWYFSRGFNVENSEVKVLNVDATDEDIDQNRCVALRELSSKKNDVSAGNWICFQGDGELHVTVGLDTHVVATLKYDNAQGTKISYEISTPQTLTIDPQNYKYEKQSDGTYLITLNIENLELSDLKLMDTSYTGECVFTKLRTPEKSRVADFSEKSPLNGVDDLTMNEQNYRGYNESAGYWETSTENHVDSNVFSNCGFNISEFRGDFYFLIEDIGDVRPLMRLFNRSKGPNTYQGVRCEEYYFGGLHRRHQDYLETRGVNYVSFDIDNAPTSAKVRYYMAGFTLPMNSTLYYSYYEGAVHKGEWYKDSSDAEYPDASEAAKNLAKAALAKLAERSDLRIYLIKFRAPAQYKNNMTGKAADFDYTYLEGYATASGGKVYTIANDSSAEANLAAKLTEIAADIKKFAGYSAAKIEE